MNERMYELINQCFIGTTDGKLSDLNTVANIEKFAELIIRECVNICKEQEYEYWRSPEEDQWTPIDIADAIAHHFGVGQ